ncbi:MAG: hypothetical protein D6725_00575 [Planctomycetota bacterium]|nr:MAG: hypothetical protein D6725_00575 [Planctomycetota bacterium]
MFDRIGSTPRRSSGPDRVQRFDCPSAAGLGHSAACMRHVLVVVALHVFVVVALTLGRPTIVTAIDTAACVRRPGLPVQVTKIDTARTLMLSARVEQGTVNVTVDPVSRGNVNDRRFIDLAGLRLWTADDDSQRLLRDFVRDPARAIIVRNRVAQAIMRTGVEPDMIPVRGDEGKTLGTQNMVLIKGGEFTRPGVYWDASGGGLGPDDKPFRGDRYRVRVSSFWIDRYKVTNEQYCRFLNDGNAGYWTPWNLRIGRAAEGRNRGKFVPADASLARHPVVLVNWYQARGYAEWAGKRLPTEAEWEFAATGPEGRTYPWGNEPPDRTRADYPVQHKYLDPVDAYPAGATPDGVFQMAGNSGEWCADYYDNVSYRKAPPEGVAINPTGARVAFQPDTWYRYRVMFKGWCKANRPEYFTCFKRNSRPPLADASAGISFRCVKSVESEGKK